MSDFMQQDLEWGRDDVSPPCVSSEDSSVFTIKARFGDGYTWSKLLNSIKKYGQLMYEAYWYGHPYSGDGSRSISRGEYRVETREPSKLKKSLTWLQKTEDMILKITEEKPNPSYFA
ncbi:MAG: hypothetical protein ACLFVP_07125 [Candidatus Bathyarchaeia archaeon]